MAPLVLTDDANSSRLIWPHHRGHFCLARIHGVQMAKGGDAQPQQHKVLWLSDRGAVGHQLQLYGSTVEVDGL